MSSLIFMIVLIAAFTGYNFVLGRQWSRLDHNPWRGKPFGGFFHTPHPGSVPARLSIEQIRFRGRVMMVIAPIAFIVLAAVLISSYIFKF